MIRDLIKKLRNAADSLEDVLVSLESEKTFSGFDEIGMLKGKTPNEKKFISKFVEPNPDQELSRLTLRKRNAMLKAFNEGYNPKAYKIKYNKLKQPRTKKHWMQLPKNKKKVMAIVRKMHKGLRAKHALKVS